ARSSGSSAMAPGGWAPVAAGDRQELRVLRAAPGDGLSRSAVPGSRAILRPAAIASVLALLALAAPAAAQPPRAADGHPDLSGVWTNASVTHLPRMPGVKGLV